MKIKKNRKKAKKKEKETLKAKIRSSNQRKGTTTLQPITPQNQTNPPPITDSQTRRTNRDPRRSPPRLGTDQSQAAT